MTPTRQTLFGPDKGNCFSAVIASLLDIPIEEAWYFGGKHDPDWQVHLQTWANKRGYVYVYIPSWLGIIPAGYHEISGKSPRGTYGHSVVGKDGNVVFDPHPDDLGVSDINAYGIFIKKDSFARMGIGAWVHRSGYTPTMYKPLGVPKEDIYVPDDPKKLRKNPKP